MTSYTLCSMTTTWMRTHAFHVEMEDVLKIHRQTGEQSVVAPVVGEVSNGDRPDRRWLRYRQPRNFQRPTLYTHADKQRINVADAWAWTPRIWSGWIVPPDFVMLQNFKHQITCITM